MSNKILGSSQRGFTLLEILVALFVFAIISVLMTGALRSVMMTQEGTEKNAKRLRELQNALLIFSRDVEQTINRPVINPSGKEEASFIGEPRYFVFTHLGFANPTGRLAKSSIERTRYLINEHAFFRETWPVIDAAPTTHFNKRQLLAYVSDVRFKYVDKNGRYYYTWPPLLQSNQALPRAVSITFTFPDWGTLSQLYVISGQSKTNIPPTQAS